MPKTTKKKTAKENEETRSALFTKIKEAKDALGVEQANIIAQGYPLEDWDESKGSAKSIFNPNDNTPSMMWNKQESYFKDFSTGKTFGIIDFFKIKYKESFTAAAKRLLDLADVEYEPDLFSFSTKVDNADYFLNYKYPHAELPLNDTVKSYQSKRGISEDTCNYFGIGSDQWGNVVYNMYDTEGQLITVKYRASHSPRGNEPKYWYQAGADTAPVLFGIDKADPTKPLLLTEGMQDCMAAYEAGFTNVVSIPSGAEDTNWIEFNYEFLDRCEDIILWYDNDLAGQDGIIKAAQRLGEYRVKLVKLLPDDEAAVENYYQDITHNTTVHIRKTDANNILLACGKERVLAVINSAEEIPLDHMVDLMTVEPFNIAEVGYLPSGFASLDREIFGYVNGTFNIWTAYAGCGKTSLLSKSAILETADSGESVFWFNSESSKETMSSWLLSQAASRKHMVEYTSQNGFKFYRPTVEAVNAMKQFYSKKILVYDNLLMSNPDNVLDKMKSVYRRRGTKVFVLDNWMCLNFRGVSEQDVAGAQVEFLNKLIHMKEQYGWVVHIVAHPKKPSINEPLNQYSLLGTSNLTNLADRIFGLEKNLAPEFRDGNYDRQVTVFKDRILGKQGARVGLIYDPVTRRLYSNGDQRDRVYNWDDGSIQYASQQYNGGVIVGNRVLDCDMRVQDVPY